MFLDTDFNNTGFQGIDYQVEVKWNNKTRDWIREFQNFLLILKSEMLQLRIIIEFFNSSGNFVNLHADLAGMGFPNQYKVFFYASHHEMKVLLGHWVWLYGFIFHPPMLLYLSHLVSSE
jgi:hypothetical protein